MGASADGTKSLFTSTQMLTDNANTGPEHPSPTIATAELKEPGETPDGINLSCLKDTEVGGIAVSGDHIYWTRPTAGSIARARLNCTDAEPAFIPDIGFPQFVAVDGDHVFWTNRGELNQFGFPEARAGSIGRATVNLVSEEVDDIRPEFVPDASNPQGIAVVDEPGNEYIYWANSFDQWCVEKICHGPAVKSIARATLEGSDVHQTLLESFLSSASPMGVAISGENILWTLNSGAGFGDLESATAAGTDRKLRVVGETRIGGIAVNTNHVYWADEDNDTIGRGPLDLNSAAPFETDFITGAESPLGLAVGITATPQRLYWSANGEGRPNPGNDLYRYDSTKPVAERLTDLVPDHGDPNGAEVRGVLGTSADGSYVYFVANGVPDGLTGSPNARGETAEPGDCQGILHQFAMSGTCNLYLAHDGSVRFIARLDISKNELETDAMNWASTPKGIFPNSALQKTSRVTPDGRALLFRSQRQLSDYPSEGTSELYLYRADTGDLVCVSCNPTGARPEPVGLATLGSITTPAVIPTPPASTLSHNLSSDGDRVFFETTDALVSTDTNGELGCPRVGAALQAFPACADTYEWEAQGTGSCEAAEAVADGGCVYLISTGKGTEPQLIADASADGSEVFFFTRSRLVGQDEDSLMDVYDARVNGGASTQNQPPSPPRCEAEGCKPEASAPPQVQSPAAITGPENPPIKRPRCRKPKHLVKGRCRRPRHHGRANGVAG
jgi:hypothetical protein